MAKVVGPVLSISASKSLKKTVTYQRRPSGHAIYRYTKPGDRVPFISTASQNIQRSIIGSLVAQWKLLNQSQKEEWDRKANLIGYVGTGYHYFIHMKGNLVGYTWADLKVAWSDDYVGWSGY